MTKENNEKEVTVLESKLEALKQYIEERKITGFQVLEPNDNVRILRSNLLIEAQTLPLFIILDNTVYSLIQVAVAKVPEGKKAHVFEYANEMNDRYGMLKYNINKADELVVTFSIPAGNDKFDPALVFALLDQIKQHLETEYTQLMKNIWLD